MDQVKQNPDLAMAMVNGFMIADRDKGSDAAARKEFNLFSQKGMHLSSGNKYGGCKGLPRAKQKESF